MTVSIDLNIASIAVTYTIGTNTSFFFNDTATTEIYTLSLHDALPIFDEQISAFPRAAWKSAFSQAKTRTSKRSEEHTSELQSQFQLVCRLLLEKKKSKINRQSSNLYRSDFHWRRRAGGLCQWYRVDAA